MISDNKGLLNPIKLFQKTWKLLDKLNKRTIKDVLNSMKSKDLIWYYDKFVKKILVKNEDKKNKPFEKPFIISWFINRK